MPIVYGSRESQVAGCGGCGGFEMCTVRLCQESQVAWTTGVVGCLLRQSEKSCPRGSGSGWVVARCPLGSSIKLELIAPGPLAHHNLSVPETLNQTVCTIGCICTIGCMSRPDLTAWRGAIRRAADRWVVALKEMTDEQLTMFGLLARGWFRPDEGALLELVIDAAFGMTSFSEAELYHDITFCEALLSSGLESLLDSKNVRVDQLFQGCQPKNLESLDWFSTTDVVCNAVLGDAALEFEFVLEAMEMAQGGDKLLELLSQLGNLRGALETMASLADEWELGPRELAEATVSALSKG